MKPFDRAQLADLLVAHDAPCVTICVPTRGRPPESTQDAVRFANAVKQARAQVEALPDGKALMRDGAVIEMFRQLDSIADGTIESNGTRSFWNAPGHGLAVFAAPGFFAWHRVPLPLSEIVVVADSFHVKPLLPLLTYPRFHVLSLSRDEVRVLDGTPADLVEMPLRGVPANLREAVGSEWDDRHQGRSFHGAPDAGKARGGGRGAGVHFHGFGGGDREEENELVHFFRAVDRAVAERFSRPTGRPLILAASSAHQGAYRALARDPALVSEGVVGEPRSLSNKDLHCAAWAILEPQHRAGMDRVLDQVGAGLAHGRAATDLNDIGRAAVQGRIAHLVLGEGRRAWGHLDRSTGDVTLTDRRENGDDDVLDDLAEVVLLHGGTVLTAAPERLPPNSHAAASYRW